MKSGSAATLVRRVQRGLLVLASLGGLYLVWRVDVLRIPSEGCSPVLRFAPGALLLVDGHPPRLRPGDVVLFAAEDAPTLYLGRVEREDAGRLWIVTDNPTCPGTDSDDLGWIPRERIRGRALVALPW